MLPFSNTITEKLCSWYDFFKSVKTLGRDIIPNVFIDSKPSS